MTELPFVSVVMPARNEQAHIGKALASVAVLDYPKDRYEVIVVDNNSSDATPAIATASGALVLSTGAPTVGEVRNTGAARARGDILAFVDSDCVVPPGWLREGVAALSRPGTGAVGNDRCRAPTGAGWVERAWAGDPPTLSATVTALATSSFIIRRALFDQLGGFNVHLSAGEDDDLSARIRHAGYTLLAIPECTVVHLDYPNTLVGIMKRQLWHGRSQLQTSRGGFDRLLILTHLFALCVFGGAGTILSIPSTAISLFILSAGLATSAAIAKRDKSVYNSLAKTVQLSLIMWFFLLGRSVGLARNYIDLAAAGFDRKR